MGEKDEPESNQLTLAAWMKFRRSDLRAIAKSYGLKPPSVKSLMQETHHSPNYSKRKDTYETN